MNSEQPRIVFMGTPSFAVGVLDRMLEEGMHVVSVVTAVDKPSGRGQQLSQSAVKQFALEKNLPLLQPERLKDEEFINTLQELRPDIFIVVAFRMLPTQVWTIPPKGTINLHASLLPNYRGAAPINWAIINGEKETGVTTFFIEHTIDTGNIIEQTTVPITFDETAGTLHDKLMHAGADLVAHTVALITRNEIESISQSTRIKGNEKSAPKLFKEDGKIDWTKTTLENHNHIRGLSPYPGAWCTIVSEQGEYRNLKVHKATPSSKPTNDSLEILQEGTSLFFPCRDGYLEILELQIEGKRKMTTKEFLVGNSLQNYRVKIERQL